MKFWLFCWVSYTTNTFCFTLSLYFWYSIPCLVWFGQLLNPMKKTFFRVPFSRNSKSSVWNTNFISGQGIPIFFALHCQYTVDTQYRFWFDLDNSLTRWTRTIFKNRKKFAIREIRKIPYENPSFSRMKTQFFLNSFCFTLSLHWWYSIPSLVWFGQLSLHWWYSIPVWFGHTLITLVILHTEFGLIWSTPWPKENDFFRKFSKIRNSRNSQNSVWKPIFFS